ncbi:MAG: hypothetical protein K8F59_04035 [Rhodobacteraceae bacterium]|nr:hypothetical protein [Paracoccaceae bacterium]
MRLLIHRPTWIVGILLSMSVASSAQAGTAFENWQTTMFACQKIVLKLNAQWGQSPDAYFSGNPQVSGQLQKGTMLRLLGAQKASDGSRMMRIEVFPSDGKIIGKSGNKVWVAWGATSTEEQVLMIAYSCED